MLNPQNVRKSSFLIDFTAINSPTSDVTNDVIDVLRLLGLSKCSPALCQKLIYETAIFHSINRESCDKLIYDIAEGSILICLDVAVRL